MPKNSQKLIPQTKASQKIKTSQKQRISVTFIQAFDSEKSAKQIVAEVESHPLFEKLTKLGVVKKKAFVGRIPPEKMLSLYKELEKEAYALLNSYALSSHPDLREAIYRHSKSAMNRILKYADQRGLSEVEQKEIECALKNAGKSVSLSDYLDKVRSSNEQNVEDVAAPQKQQYSPQECESLFCEHYDVSERDFQHYFLTEDSQKLNESEIAISLDCSLEAVVAMRSVIAHAEVEVGENEIKTPKIPVEEGYVATIISTPDGWDVRMPKGHELYIVLGSVDVHINEKERAEWRKLESKMRAINERSNRCEQAIRFICRHQSAYLATKDINELAPLSQGDIAQAIGCDSSRVSRLLFNDDLKDETKMHRKKSRQNGSSDSAQLDESDEDRPGPQKFITIHNDHDRIFLRDLLCGLDKVVHRLAKQHPDYSDAGIAKLILEKFGVHRTRSAVQNARTRHCKSDSIPKK